MLDSLPADRCRNVNLFNFLHQLAQVPQNEREEPGRERNHYIAGKIVGEVLTRLARHQLGKGRSDR